jgi:exodeoxyribonuclease VII large subunit
MPAMGDSIISAPVPGSNLPEYTVSEISQAVKRTLEDGFQRVRVRGEVSKPNYHSSGHIYFSLKDEGAVIDAVCWRSSVARLKLRVEHGMELVVTGRVSSYPGSSKYQLIVDEAELAGEGALLKMLEERRKRLAAEGLFDAARKRPLPFLPEVIGVITSPTGAVIRDILHRLEDRFPRRVLLWPVKVQGDSAAAQVVAAIAGFNRLPRGGPIPRPDVIIVARGGGSLEDLMPFNEESVVRAVVASAIPLISAVGHETDTTLIDFASDRRAPTPTAAAEMAVPVRAELLNGTAESGLRLDRAAQRLLGEQRVRLEGLARGLIHPARLLEEMTQRLDGWTERLGQCVRAFFAGRQERLARLGAGLVTPQQLIDRKRFVLAECAAVLHQDVRHVLSLKQQRFAGAAALLRPEAIEGLLHRIEMRLNSLAGLLDSYSYERVLARGFVLVRDAKDRPVVSAGKVATGASLRLQFADGQVPVTATGGSDRPAPASAPAAPKRKPDDKQGSLL